MSKLYKSAIPKDDLLQLTATIVSAHVSHNLISREDLCLLIRDVYTTLQTIDAHGQQPASRVMLPKTEPAVPINQSVTGDYIICLEDGKKVKMLKRYLANYYSLTPEAYKKRWNLPVDYPMIAPNYSKLRSTLAKRIRLGYIAKR